MMLLVPRAGTADELRAVSSVTTRHPAVALLLHAAPVCQHGHLHALTHCLWLWACLVNRFKPLEWVTRQANFQPEQPWKGLKLKSHQQSPTSVPPDMALLQILSL